MYSVHNVQHFHCVFRFFIITSEQTKKRNEMEKKTRRFLCYFYFTKWMKNIRKICCFAQCLHTYHVHRTLIHPFKEILSLHFYFDISMSRHSFSVTDEHQKLFMLMLFRIILLHIFVVPFLLDSNISLFRIFFSFFHCCVFFFLISCFFFGTFTEFFYYFNLLCSFFLYNIPL